MTSASVSQAHPERHGSGPWSPSGPASPRRAPGASLFPADESVDVSVYSFRSVWRRFFPRRAAVTADRLRRQLVHPRASAVVRFAPMRPTAQEIN